MKEARIICTCQQIRISDLNLILERGQTAYVSQNAAFKSQDLARARNTGGVAVQFIQRCQEERPPGDDTDGVAIPPVPRRVKPAPPTPSATDNTQKIMRFIEAELRRQLGPLVEDMRALRESTPMYFQDPIHVTHTAGPPIPARPADVQPLFIPTVEGGTLGNVSVSVKQTVSDEGTVSDAAAVLRGLRKKREEPDG